MGSIFRRIFGGHSRAPRPIPDLPPAPPLPKPYDSLSVGMNVPRLTPMEVAHLRLLGIQNIRITGNLERWRHELSYGDVMREVDAAASAYGLRVLWVLHNAERGYFHQTHHARHALIPQTADFCAFAASLSATEAVQPWNEPDEWHQAPFGAWEGAPAREAGRWYAEQLNQAGFQMARENPEVLLVSAGVADKAGSQRADGFLEGMLAEAPALDVVGRHAYGPHTRTRGIAMVARELMERLPVRTGDATRPARLWLTEFGNDQGCTDAFDPESHLRAMESNVMGFTLEPLAERIYWYTLNTDPQCPVHGLFRPHPAGDAIGETRAAYVWLAHDRAAERWRGLAKPGGGS